MPIEIEKKFLVKSNEYKNLSLPLYCKQGYFNNHNELITRIRIMGKKGYLTLKSNNKGIERLEYEYEIPIIDAEELLSNYCSDSIIEKNRYIVPYKDKIWEVDEFLGDNVGLTVAEIELLSQNEVFLKPRWIGKEVSHNLKYSNYQLTNHPYKKWQKINNQ